MSSFVIVFFAAPVIRTVLRMLMPSVRHPVLCALLGAQAVHVDHYA
jgi:hypothetical protein